MSITGIGIKWGGIGEDLFRSLQLLRSHPPRLLDAIKLSGAEENALATAQSHGTKRGDQKGWVSPCGTTGRWQRHFLRCEN